jgi:hypothetical protein
MGWVKNQGKGEIFILDEKTKKDIKMSQQLYVAISKTYT